MSVHAIVKLGVVIEITVNSVVSDDRPVEFVVPRRSAFSADDYDMSAGRARTHSVPAYRTGSAIGPRRDYAEMIGSGRL